MIALTAEWEHARQLVDLCVTRVLADWRTSSDACLILADAYAEFAAAATQPQAQAIYAAAARRLRAMAPFFANRPMPEGA